MFFQLLSHLITDKLLAVAEIRTLRSGTLLESANSPLNKMLTLTGSLTLNSIKTLRTQSLFPLLGIRLLKFGTTPL